MDTGTLELHVDKAGDLPNVEVVTQTQDPYCKIYLGAHRARTEVHTDGGLYPVWRQDFKFAPVSKDTELRLEIFDKNVWFRDVLIGTASTRLSKERLDGTPFALPVITKKGETKGFIALTLKFVDLRNAHNVHAAPAQPQHGYVFKKTDDIGLHYDLGKELGRGSYGTTRIATDKKTKKQFACKIMSKRQIREECLEQDVRTEIQVMHHLNGRHPAIISVVDVFEDTKHISIVMELCTGGELFQRITDKLQRSEVFTERDASRILKTMVEVVGVCHSCGVLHRDIKPENFLFSDKAPDAPLKAIDFGLGCFFKEGDIFTERLGSVPYMAPEVWQGRYGKECDIWSCGVILYILLCGSMPFLGHNDSDTRNRILTHPLDLRSDPWPRISPAARDCVARMLVRDPAKRATAQQILEHDWVRVDGVADDRVLEPEFLKRIRVFANANRWKQNAMKMLASTLDATEIEGLRQMFMSIDRNGDGTLTIEELKAGLKAKGSSLAAVDMSLLMNTDLDGSGSIDFEEFLTATVNYAAVREDRLKRVFAVYDRDGSGTITPDELQAVLADLAIADVHTIMAKADTNKDGHIDFEEFMEMMRSQDA